MSRFPIVAAKGVLRRLVRAGFQIVNYPVAELRGIKNNYSTLCYGDQG